MPWINCETGERGSSMPDSHGYYTEEQVTQEGYTNGGGCNCPHCRLERLEEAANADYGQEELLEIEPEEPEERCSNCRRWYPESEVRAINVTYGYPRYRLLCEGCQENVVTCERCGETYMDDSGSGTSYCERYCGPCEAEIEEEENRPQSYGSERKVAYRGERNARQINPFGTEIECVFTSAPGFDVGDYHSGFYVGPPFFGQWKSEEDGSLPYGESAELIAPILHGQGGLAEVIATMRLLRTEFNGGVNSACGGHVTVGCPDYPSELQVLRLCTILEEALFATTGAYRRFTNASYCRPLKHNTYGYARIVDGGNPEDKYTATYAKAGAVEFRYPPGTLNGTQFAINLGIAQLLVRMGERVDTRLVDKLVRQSVSITRADAVQTGSVPKWALFALYGLTILNSQGWHEGGSYIGMPHNPAQPPTIRVTDEYRHIEREVTLPSARDVHKRLYKQITKFFTDGLAVTRPSSCEYSTQQLIDAALSCISKEGPNDTVKFLLKRLLPDGEVTLPTATKIPSRVLRERKEREERRRLERESRTLESEIYAAYSHRRLR